MARKNYDLIDLMKFIASFFVVAIHSDPLKDISPLANSLVSQGIARLAVPLFFITSAFFFFRKEVCAESVKKYCSRVGKLYLCWFIISLPITIFNRFFQNGYSLPVLIFRFIRSFFFTSTFSGSWFLTSCAFCSLLFFLLEKLEEKRRRRLTIVISAAAYLLCVFTSAYGKLMEPMGLEPAFNALEMIFAKPYTSILVGIPYFALGRYLARRDSLPAPNRPLACICMVLLLAEILLTDHFGLIRASDCFLMLLPCSYFIFTLVAGCGVKLKYAETLRNLSTVIYFAQFIWLFVLEFAEYALSITIPCLGKFFIASVLCVITYYIFDFLQKRDHFHWVRCLY